MPQAPWILWPLLALWALWVLQSAIAAGQVAWFAQRLGRRPRPYARFRPRAWVIVPVKGQDHDLPAALHSLCRQAYPRYHLVFVVESADDPAYAVIRDHLAACPTPDAQLLIAGISAPDQGQKVHNQLAALRHLEPLLSDDDVLVFADSDAVPDGWWLASLVGPLSSDRYGATTGYRWLVPVPGPDGNVSLASRLASVINSSVACVCGRSRVTFAWGGSMAVCVRTARRGDLAGRLRGAVTDDYPLTRLCRDLNLKVRFVPRCLVPTPVSLDFAGLWNFGRRQYLITRVYVPRLYAAALLFTSIYLLGLLAAWGWLVASLLTGHLRSSSAAASLLAIILVAIANMRRAAARRRVVARAFPPAIGQQLRPALRLDRWATPVWMTLHWLLIVRALFGRTMTWRGVRYRLLGPQSVERLGASSAASPDRADTAACATTAANPGRAP